MSELIEKTIKYPTSFLSSNDKPLKFFSFLMLSNTINKLKHEHKNNEINLISHSIDQVISQFHLIMRISLINSTNQRGYLPSTTI